MHRAPTLRIPLPRVDAGLLSNLALILCLAAICVAVAFLSDWRWGLLSAGILGVVATVFVQRQMAVVESGSNVTPLKKAG